MKQKWNKIIGVGILVLSLFDALMTLRHMRYGMEEGNPLMAYLIAINPMLFIAVKMFASFLAVYLLIRFGFRRLKSIYPLTFIFIVYFILGLFHIYLLFFLNPT